MSGQRSVAKASMTLSHTCSRSPNLIRVQRDRRTLRTLRMTTPDCRTVQGSQTSFSEVRSSVNQLLGAERAKPKLQYQGSSPFTNQAAADASALGQRGWHPRPVSETPGWFRLRSKNYDLLETLCNDVAPPERGLFYELLVRRIYEPNPFRVYGSSLVGMGELKRTYSELPLIGEIPRATWPREQTFTRSTESTTETGID